LFCSMACDVIWSNGKLRGTVGGFTTVAPWTWRHTGGRMDIMPEARWKSCRRLNEDQALR
jgi:hypothetical protein